MTTDKHEKYLLYADDDVDDQEIMRDIIASINPDLEVVTVENGLEVLEFLRSLPEHAVLPCFIILDVNMPQFDGIQTLQQLKADKHLENIPVVMFSTSNEPRYVNESMKLGAQDFITKPIRSCELSRVTAQFSDYFRKLPTGARALNR